MTGSGKTTFGIRYLLNVESVCRFVFDDLGRVAARLRMPPVRTARECELALSTGWVVFNPHKMFPGRTERAFHWYCGWVYECSKRAPGPKQMMADEFWQWTSPHFIPPEVGMVAQAGREEGLELVTCSQLPHKIHAAVTGQATEIVCFRLDERLALQRVRELGIKEDVSQLPLGHFISRNRLSGVQLRGKLW